MQRIAIAGATGYIGGRLAPRLLEAGYSLRCLVRSPRKLDGRQLGTLNRSLRRATRKAESDAMV